MKLINKLSLFLVALAGLFITACDKMDTPVYHEDGKAVTLAASKTSITPAPSDSMTNVVSFSWNNPNYATDSANQKFILEIDSATRNFSKKITRTVNGSLSTAFTGKELNDMLADFGFAPGQTFSFDIRVTSSYANNNEMLRSNVIKVDIKSYLVPITLVPSSTTAQVLLVSNATNNAVSFNWNASNYGSNTIYYALQAAVKGTNFATPQVKQLGSSLTTGFTVNELNSMAIAAGVSGGSTKDIEFRVVSYLGAAYTTPLVFSNVITINTTTFTPIPANLYIVGDATPLGWTNDASIIPTQQFTKIDDVSYGLVINLTAGNSYLLLPVAGNWDHKYGGTSATGGTLLSDGAVPGSNTPAPAVSGLYKVVVNFQTGTYTVTPFTSTIPANLYIVGDATPKGWTNDATIIPTQQFTKLDGGSFGMIINLTAGGSYLFLPVAGNWDHKYGGSSATGGTVLVDGAVPGSNTPAPATSGLYKVVVNFITNTYTVTPYTGVEVPANLYVVGDATPKGWTNDATIIPSQQFTRNSNAEFTLTVPLLATGSYLMLPVAGNWDHKFGGTDAASGTLLVDGAVPGSNTPAPSSAGNYLITVNFFNMKYTVRKL